MTRKLLTKIVETKDELHHLPVIANVDFGHTSPIITFPVGGSVELTVQKSGSKITIINH